MSKLKELKKSKPVKLNSAEQSLLSKYLKPRPRSPEPKEEPKVEPKLEPVPAEAPEPEKEMPEPTIPETIPVPLNINEQTVENETESSKENHVFVVPAIPIQGARKTVKGIRSSTKYDGSKSRLERLKRLDALNLPSPEGPKKRTRESDGPGISPDMKKKRVVGKVAMEPSAMKPPRAPASPEDYIPNDTKSCRQLVLKLLSPYFNAGKFAEKSHFKELAKKVTESLVKVDAKTSKVPNTKNTAKMAIKRAAKNFFFECRPKVQSSEDLEKFNYEDIVTLRQPKLMS